MGSIGFSARELTSADGATLGILSPAVGIHYFQEQQITNQSDVGFQVQVQGASADFSAVVSFELRAYANFEKADSTSVMARRNAAWCPFQVGGSTYTQTLTPASGFITSTGKLTFFAKSDSAVGNEIIVKLVAGGTAGAEIVTLASSESTGVTTISVTIASGTSTAAQVKAALDGTPSVAALISTVITTAGVMAAGSVQLTGGTTFVDLQTAASRVRVKVSITAGSCSSLRSFFCAKN